MKTNTFFGIFAITIRCGRKKEANLRKKLEQYQDYILKLMTIRFFYYNFLHESFDLVFISILINIYLMNESTKQEIFSKSLDFIFFSPNHHIDDLVSFKLLFYYVWQTSNYIDLIRKTCLNFLTSDE
jgi:hypothetical protein